MLDTLRKKINNFKWLMQWRGRQIAYHRPYMSLDLMNYFRWLHLRRNARIFVPCVGKAKICNGWRSKWSP